MDNLLPGMQNLVSCGKEINEIALATFSYLYHQLIKCLRADSVRQ